MRWDKKEDEKIELNDKRQLNIIDHGMGQIRELSRHGMECIRGQNIYVMKEKNKWIWDGMKVRIKEQIRDGIYERIEQNRYKMKNKIKQYILLIY